MPSPRCVGRYSVIAAPTACLIAPLLALAYFATADGAESLQAATVSAWASPAADALSGLLDWASPGRVYSTYLQLLAAVFPSIMLCARAVRVERPQPMPALERRGWRTALTGYWLLSATLIAVALILIPASPTAPAVNAVFVGGLVPGILISTVGSSMLGIALIRDQSIARGLAWPLALAFPLLLVGSVVAGHNSIGLLPLFVAWAVAGRPLAQRELAPRARHLAADPR